MAIYNGQLNANKIYTALFNMIISIEMFTTGISDLSGIYSSRKVDGTLYGDTKLYISTDVLKVYDAIPGRGTSEYNILSEKRAPEPKIESIKIDQFKQIPLTTDEYLTKQAWLDDNSFSQFNGTLLSWLGKTKEVYEHTKFTSDLVISGTAKAKALPAISLAAPQDIAGYDLLVWRAQELIRQLDDNLAELKEPSRTYNDLGFLRNYSKESFDIIVPLGIVSNIRKHDIPFLFNNDGTPIFKEVHWKYFGTKNATAGTTLASNTTVRALVPKTYGTKDLIAGDLLPNSTDYDANETYTATYTARPSINDAITILLMHKKDFPIMSAFSVNTNWFDAQKLWNQHYLTFGHNDVFEAHLGEHALLKVATTV